MWLMFIIGVVIGWSLGLIAAAVAIEEHEGGQ